MTKKVILSILVVMSCYLAKSQKNDSLKSNWGYNISADLVSKYVWRGSLLHSTPSAQPTLEVSYKNFALGAWGSQSLTDKDYSEVDVYLNVSLWKFNFIVWDYYFASSLIGSNRYFNYSEKETKHDLSLDVLFKVSQDFPLKLTASYNFYGNDSLHSSYFEASYPLQKKLPLEFVLGFTPSKGWYGNGVGVVNIGASLTKSIIVNPDYKIPIFVKLILNPQQENIFMVFGCTF